MNELFNSELLEEIDNNESKIRKVMGDNTMKKVIIVVLTLMFLIPLFDSEVYTDQANSFDFTTKNINHLLEANSVITIADIITMTNMVLEDHKDEDFPLVYFKTPFDELPSYQSDDFFNIRISDFVASSETLNTDQIMALRPSLTLRDNFSD